MIANGVDLVTTANELGHANATTTASIYAHQIAIAKANVRAGVFAGRSAKPKKSINCETSIRTRKVEHYFHKKLEISGYYKSPFFRKPQNKSWW